MLRLTGKCSGIKVDSRTDNRTGEVTEKTYVGISTKKLDGFEGETIVEKVKLNDDQIKSGLGAELKALSGKLITLHVKPYPYSFNNKAGLAWGIEGDGRPLEIEGKLPNKAA